MKKWYKLVFVILIIILIKLIIYFVHLYFQVFDSGIEKRNETKIENQKNGIVTDVTQLYKIQTKGIIVPHSTEEIAASVKENDHVSIGGGRYSMGGQTASTKAVQIDMREFNKIFNISTTTKEVIVQAGATWKDIQREIDKYDLSIKIMQTYSNFTVGGSLSVNVHGRYIGYGPIVMSVKKIKVVLANGNIVEATPDENKDVFYSSIGGLGGIGVITEVTLSLEDNVKVEREVVKMPIENYKDYFFNNIRSSSTVVLHNGDIYPMDMKTINTVSWVKSQKATTTFERFVDPKKDYWKERLVWIIMSEWPFGKQLREYIVEPLIYSSEEVHTRNYEASYDVAELEPSNREKQTYVLQEYFVPVEKFNDFYPKMKEVFVNNNVNLLNVSIRHAKKDPGVKLAWAKSEVFAYVVYYKQGTDENSKNEVAKWTRQMIDLAISFGGSYYLPYQPVATEEEFLKAYPGAIDYFEIKRKLDPTNKFTNNLWEKYYDPEKIENFKEINILKDQASTTKDYARNIDNMYLEIPEWYIVYSAGEYANVLRDSLPSYFDYRKAVKDYWDQYEKVKKLTIYSKDVNKDYLTVLNVIGWSFTFENNLKWIYENIIGKFT